MRMAADDAIPTTIVIFGASGDLAARKLIPALFNNYRKGRLPARTTIVGYARTKFSDDEFRNHLREGMQQDTGETFDPAVWEKFAALLVYFQGDYQTPADFLRLRDYLHDRIGEPANRVYYLATVPTVFAAIACNLGMSGLAEEDGGWRRIVIEKPYGTDLQSALALDQDVHSAFDESQVYRIDHYLGKETAQNILFFRFANTIFEPIWNRVYVNSVQIIVDEDLDVGHRGSYYDEAGVLRDMFQNHLLQLLTLVAMEPPSSFNADAIRNEKVKVLSSVRPINLDDTLRAQYDGYRQTPGVAADSSTATLAMLKLFVDNWRWRGVPFYLRSGKALCRKTSRIVIEFQCPPYVIFDLPPFTPNMLTIYIQPHEGIHLRFEAKVPDSVQETRSVNMKFHYDTDFGAHPLPDAYERLLLDIINGDAALFPRSDGIEAAWRIIDPVISGWQTPQAPLLLSYAKGSAGPEEMRKLLARRCRCGRGGCVYEEEDEQG